MIAVSLACPKEPKSPYTRVSSVRNFTYSSGGYCLMPIDLGAHDLAHYREQMNSPKSKCFLRTAFGTANRPPKYVIKRSFTVKRKMHGADYLLSITLPKGPNHLIICQYYPSFKHTEPIPLHNFLNILATNVGPVPETSVPIRF